MKQTREFHDNKSENISGESIGGSALIQGPRLMDSGVYSSIYTVLLKCLSSKLKAAKCKLQTSKQAASGYWYCAAHKE